MLETSVDGGGGLEPEELANMVRQPQCGGRTTGYDKYMEQVVIV
jgi:hypothetical protein